MQIHSGHARDLPVPVQGASAHARVSDHAGLGRTSRYRVRPCCLPRPIRRRHPGLKRLSRLNGWPVPSPANASPDTSRCPTHDKGSVWLSGRGADYSTPPPQIPACSFPAPGSRRRSNAIVGLDATDPQAHCFSVMLSPALSPEHVSQLTFPSTGRLPSAISAADVSRLCSMLQRYYAAVRLLVCSSTASSPRLPVAARDRPSDCGPNEVSQVPTRSVRP